MMSSLIPFSAMHQKVIPPTGKCHVGKEKDYPLREFVKAQGTTVVMGVVGVDENLNGELRFVHNVLGTASRNSED